MILARQPQFATSTPHDLHNYLDTWFEHLVAENGLAYRQSDSRTGAPEAHLDLPAAFGKQIADLRFSNEYHATLWRRQDGTLCQIGLAASTKALAIEVAAVDAAKRDLAIQALRLLLAARQIPPDREEVIISFWSFTPQGARGMERSIAIAPWARVKPNYAAQTQGGLAPLMESFTPSKAGQLILWYGEPGTGKTHALRALTWEWRKWCTFHYITDPEVFFGGNANYMLDVLLMRDSGGAIEDDDDDADSTYAVPHQRVPAAKRKWRLLILEDSGELMVPDAKAQTGQGLSRLLNVVDGLIGQGLKIMVLVTTNEVLKKLHPAVARPGRCAARIEFGEFKRDEAGQWLLDHGGDPARVPSGQGISLAELYSMAGDTPQTISESKNMPVGFGG